MFRHLVLGLLRDGESRHGYELTTEHYRRTGTNVSTGNFYRELQRLAGDGLIQAQTNPPNADGRRIPYQITERGRREFDEWLVTPCAHDSDLCERLLFSDRVPKEMLLRITDWWQEELWMRSKALARARDEALRRDDANSRYHALPLLLARRMKLIAAELEFIKEFRDELENRQTVEEAASTTDAPASVQPTARRGRNPARR
jgi:DNA-binding PadR family transcriptional regulator